MRGCSGGLSLRGWIPVNPSQPPNPDPAGATVADVLRQVSELDPEPPRKRCGEAPADLETICLKCLKKRPENRYHSA